MSLDDAQFSDENKALMVSYIQSPYCVVDPSAVDDTDNDGEDLDTVSVDWSPEFFDTDGEVREFKSCFKHLMSFLTVSKCRDRLMASPKRLVWIPRCLFPLEIFTNGIVRRNSRLSDLRKRWTRRSQH